MDQIEYFCNLKVASVIRQT